jgi:hypothetical protein
VSASPARWIDEGTRQLAQGGRREILDVGAHEDDGGRRDLHC